MGVQGLMRTGPHKTTGRGAAAGAAKSSPNGRNQMKLVKTTMAALVASVAFAGAAQARDQIKIVGSSTVFPYTQAVSEEYSKKSGKTAPVVESTGTGGGFKAFCAGVGEEFP